MNSSFTTAYRDPRLIFDIRPHEVPYRDALPQVIPLYSLQYEGANEKRGFRAKPGGSPERLPGPSVNQGELGLVNWTRTGPI